MKDLILIGLSIVVLAILLWVEFTAWGWL